MGWYCHPDTMAIADAQHAARAAVGADVSMTSLAYKKAYRAAYEADAKASGFDAGLDDYLKELDDEIHFFEQGGTDAEYAAFMTQRNMSTTVLFQLKHTQPCTPPSDCWSVIKRLLPNPDEVVLVDEIYAAIDNISKAVTWSESEPQWWLDMMAYQQSLAKRLSAVREPIVVGWNKGGVGTSTLCKLLAHEGIRADEHTSKTSYRKGYTVRLIPIRTVYELNTFVRRGSHLKALRELDPDCLIYIVLNGYKDVDERALCESAHQHGLTVLASLPHRRWFGAGLKDRLGSSDKEIKSFTQPIALLMEELGITHDA